MSTQFFCLPDIGEGVAEGEIAQWFVRPGQAVQEDQPLLEVMTDKVLAEIPSPFHGTIVALKAEVGQTVPVGSVLVEYQAGSGTSASAASKSQPEAPPVPAPAAACSAKPAVAVSAPAALPETLPLATPAVRKQARDKGINLATVCPSGPDGRITAQDLTNAMASPQQSATALFQSKPDQTIPFSGIRKRIAQHLTLSKQKAPHFAYVEEIDMSDVVAARAQLKPVFAEKGVKLTYLPFIMRAVLAGLAAHPILNATLDEEQGVIIQKGQIHFGIASDTPQGLLVPVLKNAQDLSLLHLASQLQTMAEKAKSGQLSPQDMQGGTFTLTSIGSIGGLFGVPIINYPEVAILGINAITPRPVVREGQVVIRDIMYLSLSCDHRVVDGADAARFINVVKEYLQAPARLLV